jgi:hypothetical protein
MCHWRTACFALVLLAFLIGGVSLWLHTQQRQYALNRRLIAALVHGHNEQTLALVFLQLSDPKACCAMKHLNVFLCLL